MPYQSPTFKKAANPVAFSAGTWYNNNNKDPGKIAETSRGENMKPFLLFDLHRNINSDVVKFIKSVLKCPSITAICTSRLNSRIPIKCFFKRVYASLCIVNICRMNVNTQEISHRICYNVPFSSLRFFPPSYP